MFTLSRALTLTLTLLSLTILALAAPGAGAATPQIASNYSLACALTDVGDVYCAGSNTEGQLGIGSMLPAPGFQKAQISGVSSIALSDYSACAIKSDRSVWCWGDNDDYELAQGGTGTTDSSLPVAVRLNPTGTLNDAVQISAQDATFCALRADTTVVCWGRGTSGQIGDGGISNLSLATQVWAGSANLAGVKKVVAGRYFSCALMISGGVKCWGEDTDGELGNGAAGPSLIPVDVENISNAVDIGAGKYHACALLADATVKCWGSDSSGQIGNGSGSTADAISPAAVPGLLGVRQIMVGYQTTCAQVADGSLQCWGSNGAGEILDPALGNKPAPVTVPGVAGFLFLAPTFEQTPCVMYRGGAGVCWGYDADGQIGVPATSGDNILTPTQIAPDLVTLAYPGENTKVSSPVKTKLDKKKKTYTLTTKLTTTPNYLVNPTDACAGAATASVKYTLKTRRKGKTVKKTKTIKRSRTLGLTGATCTSTIALKLPVKYFNGKRVKVTFTAAGNGSLQPVSTSAKFKLRKVKK